MKNKKYEFKIHGKKPVWKCAGGRLAKNMYSYVDFDYKFAPLADGESDSRRQYCDFSIVRNGTAYHVTASVKSYEIYCAANEQARAILDTRNFPEFCGKDGQIDWTLVSGDRIVEVMEYTFSQHFIDMVDEESKKLIDNGFTIDFQHPIKITYSAIRPRHRYVNVIVKDQFNSIDDVFKLRDIVIKYLKDRDMESFKHAVGFE